MKVKVIKEIKEKCKNDLFTLNDIEDDKIYEVIAVEGNDYRIVDESGEDYLYPAKAFEIVEE